MEFSSNFQKLTSNIIAPFILKPSPTGSDSIVTLIPHNILAFRTITSLLSQIQRERPLSILDLPTPPQAERQRLQILNALSNVAVADHDVVAMISKGVPGDRKIEPSGISYITRFLSQYLATKNPRSDDKNPVSQTLFSIPILKTPSLPAGLSTCDPVLAQYVQQYWSDPVLETHLSILEKLLDYPCYTQSGNASKRNAQTFYERLLLYVIAVCHKKMIRRMEHTTLSKPYMDSLCQVIFSPDQDFIVEEQQLQDSQRFRDQQSNDIAFLKFLTKNWDRTHIPHLSSLAAQALSSPERPFHLYTRETCEEFHRVFVDLLVNFREALNAVCKYRMSCGQDPNPVVLLKCLLTVFTHGVSLSKVAHGSAIEPYFRSMEGRLKAELLSAAKLASSAGNNEPDEDLEAVQPFVVTKDGVPDLWKSYRDWFRLILIHIEAVDILKEYIIKFPDPPIAIQVLVSPQDPVLDTQLLSWKELFIDPDVFPDLPAVSTESTPPTLPAALSALPGPALPMPLTFANTDMSSNAPLLVSTKSNQNILDFLAASIATVPSMPKCFQKVRLDMQNGLLGKICKHLAKIMELDHTTSDFAYDWSECARKILDLLLPSLDSSSKILKSREGELGQKVKDNVKPGNVDRINKLLQELSDSVAFFEYLRGLDNDEEHFTGSLHCEACLASLLVPTGQHSGMLIVEQLAGYEHVIGVSKRCCPTCWYLLSLLKQSGQDTDPSEQPFLVKGSHSTISGCTLPIWLPKEIVDSMNKRFGDQLRRELDKLMSKSAVWRRRAQSTGSGGRASMDSYTGQQDNNVELRNHDDMALTHS